MQKRNKILTTIARRRRRQCASNFESNNLDSDNNPESRRQAIYPYKYYSHTSRVCTTGEVWDGYNRFRKGDIISVTDSDNGKDYFAQISALITDKYAQHFAMVVWLVPKPGVHLTTSQLESFDPQIYQPFLAEERPIPIKSCEFQCSCPNFSPYKNKWEPSDVLREQMRKEIYKRITNL